MSGRTSLQPKVMSFPVSNGVHCDTMEKDLTLLTRDGWDLMCAMTVMRQGSTSEIVVVLTREPYQPSSSKSKQEVTIIPCGISGSLVPAEVENSLSVVLKKGWDYRFDVPILQGGTTLGHLYFFTVDSFALISR